jgi:hypothetical protein
MAVVAAIVQDVVVESGPHDAGKTPKQHIRAKIYVTNGATAVTGGTDTLDIVVQTVLRAAFRNAKTYTVRTFALCQTAFGTAGDEYAATITNSSGTLSLNPELIADWTTDDTIPASDLTRPYGVFVMCEIS